MPDASAAPSAPSPPPTDALPTALDVLPATATARLRAYAGGVWAALVTVPMSLAQVATHDRTPTARNFQRWAGRWARAILRVARIRVRVDDRSGLDASGAGLDGPYVFVCNHQSALDILVLAGHLPYPFGFVAKAELAEVPFLGVALRRSPSVFVDRRTPRRAVETVREAGARIRAGTSVLLFAEGRRSYQAALLPLERGAFLIALDAGVPLVPLTLLGAYRVFDERRRLLAPGAVGLVVHSPLATTGLTKRDVPALLDRVAALMHATIEADEAQRR